MSKIVRQEYKYNGRVSRTYCEWSNGDWAKNECDDHGNVIYYEDSNGIKYGTPRAELEQELGTDEMRRRS